jgi:hypothetical protein
VPPPAPRLHYIETNLLMLRRGIIAVYCDNDAADTLCGENAEFCIVGAFARLGCYLV